MEPTSTTPVSSTSSYAMPAAIIIAGTLIAGGLYFGMAKGSQNQPAGAAAKASVDVKDVKITADDPYIGKSDAPVTLVYWFDYQCPYCKAVDVGGIPQINIEPAFPTLIKNYVDTGKLKIVFKDYPFLGQDSVTAALYEHAIWATYPDKFLAWHTAMFKAQDAEGDQGFGNEQSILQLITTIPGMDGTKLKALVAKNKDAYTKAMNDDQAEGAKFGVTGTPGFITGKQSIDGAVPLSTFTAAIDPQLK